MRGTCEKLHLPEKEIRMDSLKLPGTLNCLQALGNYIEETANLAGLSPRRSENLRLAIKELATKVIIHGFVETGTAGELTVKREITGNWVIIILEDTANAYDPHAAILGEDEINAPLIERKAKGLGIFLTPQAVDHFDYERRNGRNRNKFFVRRPIP